MAEDDSLSSIGSLRSLHEEDDEASSADSVDPEVEAATEDLFRWRQRVYQRVHEHIKHLEMFSSGYEFLVILNVQQNAIEDLAPLAGISRSLRLLNVSQNAIAHLPDAGFWAKFESLTFLFLAQNHLHTWQDLSGITACAALQWLTLAGNPFASLQNARRFVVNKLVQLEALDEYLVTDSELIKAAPSVARFEPESVRLQTNHLIMPLEFDSELSSLEYLRSTEQQLHRLFRQHSPSIIVQRHVRGYLSRRDQFPAMRKVRQLIVNAQKRVRGYLFRQRIQHEFVALVHAKGQQHLLLTPTDSRDFTASARRGLKRLVQLVRDWKRKFHAKKQAVAIKKIRFWCVMVYQRYQQRANRLLVDEQELFVYYTPSFAQEVIRFAMKAACRDPFLAQLPHHERLQLLEQRSTTSGASVIRAPAQERVVAVSTDDPGVSATTVTPSTSFGKGDGSRRKTEHSLIRTPPVLRFCRNDMDIEHQALVTEKQLLQRDLKRIAAFFAAVEQTDQASRERVSQRAAELHLGQLQTEIERRLVICNKKILHAAIKQQQRRQQQLQQQQLNNGQFSLARVNIRTRGYVPSHWERKRFASLAAQQLKPSAAHDREPYVRMLVFIPWSIDMYMQMMTGIARFLAKRSGPAFALSFDQMQQSHSALAIQSAWRASRRHVRRNHREVAIARALSCIQRWWRYMSGLRRRTALLRATVQLGASINSNVLFMEAGLYYALSDPMAWRTIQVTLDEHHATGRCRERGLHCVVGDDGRVVIELSPAQLALREHYKSGTSMLPSTLATLATQLDHSHTRSAFLPLWLPDMPDCREESMASREHDGTPQLLTERVHVEPTLVERELLVGLVDTGLGAFVTSNPFRHWSAALYVFETCGQVMELSRRVTEHHHKPWQLGAVAAQSFVRLTFESATEARRRAIVLLWKTFDPLTRTYARLYSMELLFGATLLHHQWALSQVASAEEVARLASNWTRDMHNSGMPSAWWARVEALLPRIPLQGLDGAEHLQLATPLSSVRATMFNSGSSGKRGSPLTPMSPLADGEGDDNSGSGRPAPLHVVVACSLEKGIVPRPPSSARSDGSGASGGFSRHHMLAEQMERAQTPEDLYERQEREQMTKELKVRDMREERERAMEALVVDRRILQRENAAVVAGIKLDIDVKLQKLRYERELAKMNARALVEQDKIAHTRSKLKRHFEQTFVTETGAMMRMAAREAVAQRHDHRHEQQRFLNARIRQREDEADARRKDAKSFHFVANQTARTQVQERVEEPLQTVQDLKARRLQRIKARKEEDKEIKRMLKLI
ncbi:TPA: hypothetical protein N0F65_004455 [Lagenidium giganteum]|uniref:Leucine-rich repeat domain, L domain-like n=1 Tax=Lagenidium giganteum TaxID=4803 RepID=A0AAV2ZJN7_9STRA|nr:TPA: hypothetical protein N0F65_004455 [Lagenidium giganteum]